MWDPLYLALMDVSLAAATFTVGTIGKPLKWPSVSTFHSIRERADCAYLGKGVVVNGLVLRGTESLKTPGACGLEARAVLGLRPVQGARTTM